MKRLSITFFGRFEVRKDADSLVNFRYDKVRALLALLVVDAERAYRRDELVGQLWPDSAEDAARTNLRQALASLRESLGDAGAVPPYLCASRESIQWNPEAEADVDVQVFTRLLQACDHHSHRRSKDCRDCAQRRTEALRLYSGDLLQGFFLPNTAAFEEWLILHRENLRRQALAAFHDLAEYHERRGEYDLAEAIIRHHLELEPWDEMSHRQLMRLLFLNDKRSQALAQYELCKKALSTELGVEPEPATVAFFEHIRSGISSTPASKASIALPATRPHNLPPTITPFFGRESELAQIADAFDHSLTRIIALVGPGGIGKTRLALQAATEQLDNFIDGVFFIPLEGLSKREEVIFAVAHTLGLNLVGEEDLLHRLIAQMAGKELLLVLDNYEHLLPETELLVKLIGGAPNVSLLVTSRQRLNVRGEQVIEINGLSLPTGSAEEDEPAALALFAACGARARAGFTLQIQDRPYAVHICRMLDGIPLAIELAAVWLGVLSCQELAAEIERDVNILSGALRDVPERQRSLRAIFDYTNDSLSPEEAILYRRLAVFRGGFDRRAAEGIAGGSLLLLKALLDKSLIRRNFRQGYEMHELARQYACERLEAAGEAEATRRKHLDYYLNMMEELAPRLESETGPALLNRLEEDHDNLRAALDWALASANLVDGLRLAIATYRLWYWHNHAVEAQHRLEAFLAAAQGSKEPLPLDLIARASFRAGVFACEVLDWELAQRRLEDALRLSQLTGNRNEQSNALNSLGAVFFERGDLVSARRMFEETLSIDRELGQREMLAVSLSNLAVVARVRGDYDAARAYLEESLLIDREAGNAGGEAFGLANLGWLCLVQNDLSKARRSYLRSLELRQQIGSQDGIASCLEGLAMIAMASESEAETGARIYGAAEVLRKSIGMPVPASEKDDRMPFLEKGRKTLGDESWEKALQEGRQLGLKEAIRLAETCG